MNSLDKSFLKKEGIAEQIKPSMAGSYWKFDRTKLCYYNWKHT